MSDCEYLRSLGLEPAIGCAPITERPTEIMSSTTCMHGWSNASFYISTVIPWILFILTIFRFRRFLAQYLKDSFEFALSTRLDLQRTLVYEFRVGGELHSSVTMNSPMITRVAIEDGEQPEPCLELREVVVE